MANPFKLEITLKQHTPLIHFQHDQDGATLRATEVKPKLDKFLIKNKRTEIESSIKLTKNGIEYLDYKIKIENHPKGHEIEIPIRSSDNKGNEINFPFVLANMGKTETQEGFKKFVYFKGPEEEYDLKISITCFETNLLRSIEENFNEFLFKTNFGNRQTKGFGSFLIAESDKNFDSKIYTSDFNFSIEVVNQTTNIARIKKIFEQLDLFWKALRGGINESYGSGFYFKSLIFMYAFYKMNTKWDKRKVKEKFYNSKHTTQSTKHGNPDILELPLRPAIIKERMIKDLLGLSVNEKWEAEYNNSLKKVHLMNATVDINTNVIAPFLEFNQNNNHDQIDRLMSPITIKPIYMGDNIFKVFLFPNDLPSEISGTSFLFSNNTGIPFPLRFPLNTEASIHDFFDYLFLKNTIRTFNIELSAHVTQRFLTNEKFIVINRIIDEIRTNHPQNLS